MSPIYRLAGWFGLGLILSFSGQLLSQETRPHTTAIVRSGWVRTEIIMGRLTLLNTRTGQGTITSGKNGGDVQESLSVQADGGNIQLMYAGDLAGDQIALQVLNERDLSFRRKRTFAEESREVFFRQPAEGKITLRVTRGEQTENFTADNLWQLILSGDETIQLGMQEVFSVLQAQPMLKELAGKVAAELCAKTEPDRHEAWDRYVRQLGAERFADRMEADRSLRNSGKQVVGYLLHVNHAQLDSEQRQRIRRILSDLSHDAGDSPEVAASFVRDDLRVWLTILQSDDPQQQARGAAEIRRLTGRSVPIEANSSSDERREYISGLKKNLGVR